MKALWIAPDGSRHEIEADSQEQLMEQINVLRQSLGFERPTAVVVRCDDPATRKLFNNATDAKDLPDHLRRQVEKEIKEATSSPDPKNFN